jgi:hypothetical protein
MGIDEGEKGVKIEISRTPLSAAPGVVTALGVKRGEEGERMARKIIRNSGTKEIPETGEIGFNRKNMKLGDRQSTEEAQEGKDARYVESSYGAEEVARCGYRKLDYELDPHDRERNPRGGLKEHTQSDEDEVDRYNDHDGD